MKNLRSLLLFLTVLSLTLNSCQKPIVFVEGSGPGSGSGSAQQVSFRGKVDGVLLECPVAVAVFYPPSTGVNALQIVGNKGAEGFAFTIADYKGIGSYDLTDQAKASGMYIKDNLDPLNGTYVSTSGTLVISTVTDKFIKGTFNFKGINLDGKEKTITEGSFLISIAPVVVAPPAAGDKSMSAKIDGTSMSFTTEGHYIKSASIGNIMEIVGANGVQALEVTIENYKGVGEYQIDGDGTASYHTDQTFAGIYATETGVKTGKITVTSATATTVKGTFSFAAPNADPSIKINKTITDGKFEVKYDTLTAP